ncbi:TrmH family RNA methyltransferase, partial [Candidatus Gottesmanbacteria bacterium]|nr:TrmH family RNA methyltransferase [Candidatus Gottesmanbacteria bacterium]
PRNPIIFVLHNLRSLQNVGLFFRLADAIRAGKIYLTGFTGYPRSGIHAENEINKTAIKLVPHVPWEYTEDVLSVLSNLRHLDYQLVGVEQTDISINYLTPNYLTPVVLLFGHEREGLEEKLLEKCDLVVHIPMLGVGNSHNVAMSGAIISYHILNKITS